MLSEQMGHVRCARVADYAAALSRGNTYEVLDGNERNLKIHTEEGCEGESEPVHSETRWCYFVTPEYLRQRFERQASLNEPILPMQLGLNGMVLPVLNHSNIAQALRYLEMQDQLSVCTKPR